LQLQEQSSAALLCCPPSVLTFAVVYFTYLLYRHSLLRQMAAQKQENRAVKMKNTHNYRREIKKRKKQ